MTIRRRILVALPAFAPGAAVAFRLEAPSAEIRADYGAAACPAPQSHAALQAELEQLFEGQPVPPGLATRILDLARCPFCGCAVSDAADHGERETPPEG
jgi:hypothetical protein